MSPFWQLCFHCTARHEVSLKEALTECVFFFLPLRKRNKCNQTRFRNVTRYSIYQTSIV